MAGPVKKSAKPLKSDIPISPEHDEEYELMPHREIVELREELRKLKTLPPEAGSHMQESFDNLASKMDRLTEIFEEAEKSVRIEEGAVSFKQKMAPIIEKMNRILEQNSEIAEGIVALADILNEVKEKLEVGVVYGAKEIEKPAAPKFTQSQSTPGFGMPPRQGMPPMPGAPMQGSGRPLPPMQGDMQMPSSGRQAPPFPEAPPLPGTMPPPPGFPKKK